MILEAVVRRFSRLRDLRKTYSDHRDSLAMWGGSYDESKVSDAEYDAENEYVWDTYHNPNRKV